MSIVLKKRVHCGTMSCSPMVDGIRSQVTCKCDEGCKYWEDCLSELGFKHLNYKFVERPSTEYEISRGWFHVIGVKKRKVSWELIHK